MIPITRLRPSSIGRVYNISLFIRHPNMLGFSPVRGGHPMYQVLGLRKG
jgi:hypothetical protein